VKTASDCVDVMWNGNWLGLVS